MLYSDVKILAIYGDLNMLEIYFLNVTINLRNYYICVKANVKFSLLNRVLI